LIIIFQFQKFGTRRTNTYLRLLVYQQMHIELVQNQY